MPCCPTMRSSSEATALFLSTLALVLSLGKASIWDTKADDLEQSDFEAYAQEVAGATAGLGVGLSLAFGFVTFVAMIFMCCRCKRLDREDLAIAMAEGDDDGKGLDDMYEIEDYEDNISKHRKILWLFTFVVFLGYLFCAGYAYNGAKTADSSFKEIFDGTDALLTGVQNALCAENGAANCASGSVGDFMLDIADAVVDRLEGVVDFITSLSAVTAPLYWVSANLTTAGLVINGTGTAVLNINNSITSVNLILTGDGNVAEFTGGEALDTLDAAILEDIDTGREALNAAEDLTEESRIEVAGELSGDNSTIVRVKYQLDDIPGNEIGGDEDLRNTTLATVYDDVLAPMRDLTEDVYEIQTTTIVDMRDLIDNYLEMSVQAVAGLIFLPGAILFLTSLCSGICQSSKPLYLNMFFVFMTQILFCLVAGIFLAIAKLNGDVCDHHLDLIEINLDLIASNNITVQGEVIYFNFDNVYSLMTCDGEAGQSPTDTNNIVDIFGARQIFNMSDELKDASSVITDNSELLSSPKSTVVSAQNELEPLNDFIELNISGTVNVSESSAEMTSLLNDLPPAPFDWDDREHQDSLDDFYLKNVSEFSWNNESTGDVTYRGLLEDVNDIFGDMVADVLGGVGFESIDYPYNFSTARNLTGAMVCANESNFFPDPSDALQSKNLQETIYGYEEQWTHLCGNVSAYANLTELVEELVSENTETRLDLEQVSLDLSLIDGYLVNIADYQLQMAELRDDMNGSLAFLADTLDWLVVDLNSLADDLMGLNVIVMGANNYTMCGYIGDFYRNVYLGGMCTSLQGNVEAVSGPAFATVVLMFVSFCIQGCYGPSMRKRRRATAADLEGRKTRLNMSGELEQNNLPTPHSPTPLVGNSGF